MRAVVRRGSGKVVYGMHDHERAGVCMGDLERTRVATMRDELASLLDGRVKVESVAIHEEDEIVVVTLRLPSLSEAERLQLEEWVHINFESAQDGLGGDRHLLVPRYV